MTGEADKFALALSAPEAAAMLTVTCEADKPRVVAMVEAWRRMKKDVESFFGPRKAASRAVWVRDCDDEKKLLDPLEQAIKIGNRPILEYDAKIRREAEDARRKQEEAARKLEQERQAALQKAAEASKKGDEAEARKIRDEADAREVRAEIEKPVEVPPPVRTAGTRTTWRARVVDLKALCRAVADGKVPEAYVEANLTVLRPLAVAQKRRDIGVPGVEGEAVEGR